MMYKVEVSKSADKVVRKWKKSNPELFKKYKKLYCELIDLRGQVSDIQNLLSVAKI